MQSHCFRCMYLCQIATMDFLGPVSFNTLLQYFLSKNHGLIFIYSFKGLLEFQAIKTALLPRIKKLILQTSLLSVRVNGLISLGKLLPHLDKWLVMDEILPLLQQMPSREPAVIMASIGESIFS